MELHDLRNCILAAASKLGFARAEICSVEPFGRGAEALDGWLDRGMHGEMAYMAAHGARADPRALLESAKSLLVVALRYAGGDTATPGEAGSGFVARYARGLDYHAVMKAKLAVLAEVVSDVVGRPVLARPCVDTAPLLEHEAAARAGLGFIGKSTLSIVPGVGTFVLLGELLVDVELPVSRPIESRCGDCTACLDACPTGAFVEPFLLDARRCIAYVTIEQRGPIARELRPMVGTHLFGCDVCQEVCPYNAADRDDAIVPEMHPRDALSNPTLTDWLTMGSAGYRRLVEGTSLRRASRNQLARNAAVALGNAGDPSAVPALASTLAGHTSPLVRSHAAWALGQLGGDEARRALEAASSDDDASVRDEAKVALAERFDPT